MNDIKLCMIGAGGHATRNIYPCFHLLRGARVVANCDLDQARAAENARKYGVANTYTDYRAMLEAERPDGVIICVGADFHARVAMEVMEAGYHAYTEKPPALTLEQARQMLETQERTGKICMAALKKRFSPAYVKAKAVIEGEHFGAKNLLTITRTSGKWRGTEDPVNAYLRENSIHVVDLATYLFGPIDRVSATSRPHATAALTLEFASGGIGTLAVTDRMSYQRGWEIVTAIGADGVCIQVDNSVEMIAYKFDQPIAAHKPEFVAGNSQSAVEQGFSGELQGFVDAIRSGTLPDANAADSLHVMEVLEAVRKSQISGRVEKVGGGE